MSSSCHHKKPKKEAERAGYWGTPWRKCDTPLRLMNLTLDYLDATWAREIDFVICEWARAGWATWCLTCRACRDGGQRAVSADAVARRDAHVGEDTTTTGRYPARLWRYTS